jgi:pimeloyl-ACP methyl ester carboxylesterase
MLIEKTFDTDVVSLNYAEGPLHGLPLVMLHGTSLCWQTFLPNLPTFSFRYHTYALDLRGHGRSGRQPGAYRVVDHAADVVRFLRAHMAEPAGVSYEVGRQRRCFPIPRSVLTSPARQSVVL